MPWVMPQHGSLPAALGLEPSWTLAEGEGASALRHDLQPSQERCQPAVNTAVPGRGRDLQGSLEQSKGWE